jgi:hypothetical protein
MDGKPLVYGTQFQIVNGITEPFPIDYFEHADERRRRVGIDTFVENEAWIKARHR